MNDEHTAQRKDEHIDLALRAEQVDRNRQAFDKLRLTHRALPDINLDEVDPSVEFMGRTLSFPFMISSMTGGEGARLRTINENLARAAEACGVAMGVGSQRVMFTHPEASNSFDLRPLAPSVPLLANLGAVQLNYGFDLAHCRKAVEVLDADALILHLNPLQEAVQPEGNTRFSGLLEHIKTIRQQLDVPVIIKEVGAGLSRADAERLVEAGIQFLDIAGAGGTSWSLLEHHRMHRHNPKTRLGKTFQDWGIPTPDALRDLDPLRDRATLIASGGIRTGIDMAKAMILGASLCGMARPLLDPATQSAEAVIESLEQLKAEFTTALFLLGIPRATDLVGRTDLLRER
jgi:isopentenyl-diphosphate delta-isomerase